MAFGVKKHYRYVAIQTIANNLGRENSRALPFVYAITAITSQCRKENSLEIMEGIRSGLLSGRHFQKQPFFRREVFNRSIDLSICFQYYVNHLTK